MRTLLISAIALFCATANAGARKPHCTLRVHAEANANDTAIFAARVPSRTTGRAVFIERSPSIFERDVAAFYPYRAADGTMGALIQFNDHGKLWLDTLSIERRGTLLFVFVNGRPVAELQVDRRVSDGRIYIASGLTEDDIARMAKDWRLIGQRKK